MKGRHASKSKYAHARRILSSSLVLLGAALLLMTVVGQYVVRNETFIALDDISERFNQDRAEKIRDMKALLDDARKRGGGDPRDVMRANYDAVVERFVNSGASHYTLLSNWLLWILGSVNEHLSVVRDPEVLLESAYSALCSEQSSVLLMLAYRRGIAARHVGLNGHVVMEAWYHGGWHLYDPSYEVVPVDSNGEVLSVHEMDSDPDLVRTYYKGHAKSDAVEDVVRVFTTREDNNFISYPEGAQFVWKADVLIRFERYMNYLKYIIPVFMIIVGSLLRLNFRRTH